MIYRGRVEITARRAIPAVPPFPDHCEPGTTDAVAFPLPAPQRPRYPFGMEKTGASFPMKIVAVLVLAIAAWILLKVVIGIIAGVAWIIVIVLAVAGILWAWNTLSS